MNQLPGYVKYFFIIASMIVTFYLLIWAQSILSPIFAALIAALLLRPVSGFIEKFNISRGVSSILSIILVIAVFFGLSYFFSTQINNIVKDLNEIRGRLTEIFDQINTWLQNTFALAPQQQTQYLKDSLNTLLESSTSAISRTVGATADFFTAFFLFLLALFFILFYRRFFVAFLYKMFPDNVHQKVGGTINKVELVVRSYVLGLLMVIIIVAILNSVGLMILGIQHAIFFGVLAAVLTVIPYIGIFIGSLLPILFALFTKDSIWYPIGVAILFWLVQFLEGNFITPNVVGGRVSINPFAAIIALFLGGMIWGILGMVLSIPILAIVKVVCDAAEPLQPFGYLLGNPPDEELENRRGVGMKGMLERLMAKIKK